MEKDKDLLPIYEAVEQRCEDLKKGIYKDTVSDTIRKRNNDKNIPESDIITTVAKNNGII